MKIPGLTILTLFFGITVSAQQTINNKTAEEKLNEDYCTGLFKTTNGNILDVANDISIHGSSNILDWLDGRVAGLRVYTNRNGISIPVIRGGVPGIFVDEIQVSASYLNTLPVHDIAIVKVIKTPFLGGFNSGSGAIAVYTRGGEEESEDDGK